MSKVAPCKSTKSLSDRLSPSAELKVVKKIANVLKNDRTQALKLAVSAGIYTADGQLRKAFGGKA